MGWKERIASASKCTARACFHISGHISIPTACTPAWPNSASIFTPMGPPPTTRTSQSWDTKFPLILFGNCWKYRSYLGIPPACAGCALLTAWSPPRRQRAPIAHVSGGCRVRRTLCRNPRHRRELQSARARVRCGAADIGGGQCGPMWRRQRRAKRPVGVQVPGARYGTRQRAEPVTHRQDPLQTRTRGDQRLPTRPQRRPRRRRPVTTLRHQAHHLLARRIAVPLPCGFQRRQTRRSPSPCAFNIPGPATTPCPGKSGTSASTEAGDTKPSPVACSPRGGPSNVASIHPARSASAHGRANEAAPQGTRGSRHRRPAPHPAAPAPRSPRARQPAEEALSTPPGPRSEGPRRRRRSPARQLRHTQKAERTPPVEGTPSSGALLPTKGNATLHAKRYVSHPMHCTPPPSLNEDPVASTKTRRNWTGASLTPSLSTE